MMENLILAQTFVAEPPAPPLQPNAFQRKRKVLHFYQDFGQRGGIEQFLKQVGQGLQPTPDFETVFVCCQQTPLYQSLREAGLSVHGIESPPVFSRSFLRSLDFSAFRQLKVILELEQPDLIHLHIGLLEPLLFQRWGIPVALTFHGYGSLYSNRQTQNPLKKLWKSLLKRAFRFTVNRLDALWIVSRAEQARLLAEGFLPSPECGQVLANGVPLQAIQQQAMNADSPALKADLQIPKTARCVTFINRLDANKNPAHFLALAAQLNQQPAFADCYFLLAGDGPLKAEVQTACQSLPQVRYLGYRREVPALLAMTDVLVYPAMAEGFGLGLVEAMALGVPCVAYASEGAREILDTPTTRQCLVPVGDEQQLQTTVTQFLQLPAVEKQALGKALQTRSLAFDESAFMQKLTAEYRRLLPRISVLLPVYNGERCIFSAVQSVLNQSYPHLELIVIDDGSTDGTREVLAGIQDNRLRLIAQPNQGVAAARNLGFQNATGDFIAFIDADDVWLPHKIAEELKIIRQKTTPEQPVCLVYSSYYAVDEQGALINLPSIHTESGDLSEAVLAHEGIFLPSTALVHRTVFEAVGGFQTTCYHEDRVFFIEACQRFPAYSTEKRLVRYQQSLSGRCRSVLQDYDAALTAELSIVETLRDRLPPSQLETLALRQRRNLVYRFLMYGYTAQAQQLYYEMQKEMQTADLPAELFSGKKGKLALLSLKTGINFLVGARLFTQAFFRIGSQRQPAFRTINIPSVRLKETAPC